MKRFTAILFYTLILILSSCDFDSGFDKEEYESVVQEDAPIQDDYNTDMKTTEQPVQEEETPEPEPQEEPQEDEQPEPVYIDIYFLYGVLTGGESDIMEIVDGTVLINGTEPEPKEYIDGDRLIHSYVLHVDIYDRHFFINDNCIVEFGIDLQDMSMEDLIIMSELSARFPKERLADLVEEYN